MSSSDIQRNDGSWDNNSHVFATDVSAVFPKTVTIDLGKVASIQQVMVGVPPYGSTKTITVATSADGRTFQDVDTYVFTQNKNEMRGKHIRN